MNNCREEIYKLGKVVAVYDSGPIAMQNLVEAASEECGFKIDWHYVGGRAVVKTLGDVVKAESVLDKMIPRKLRSLE